MAAINTDQYSSSLRKRSVLLDSKKILIAKLSGSEQEHDLTVPANCNGYGRVRHFRLSNYENWSPNPLPILPAAKALDRSPSTSLRAQVFQNAACNWRCWYCFVDFNRLAADKRYGEYFTADELIDMFLAEPDKADVIDLTGGQPDIVPEWLFWTLEALTRRGLENKIYVWSDDNLSNFYYWEFLSDQQRDYIANYPRYARVACFKGYNATSFAFNTAAEAGLFERQFQIYEKLLREGFDMFAYVTFTALPHSELQNDMQLFVDKLQGVHPNLPLRTVPLKIEGKFTPVRNRFKIDHDRALQFQQKVHDAWRDELGKRFSPAELAKPITDVEMRLRRT